MGVGIGQEFKMVEDKMKKKLDMVGFIQVMLQTKYPNFKITNIQRYQQHLKWHKYSKERERVNEKFDSTTDPLERYLFNIFRFQDPQHILFGNDDISFELKKNTYDPTEDKMNNANNNWLGNQANYFTPNFQFTHEKVTFNQNNTFQVFLAKCIIGNVGSKFYIFNWFIQKLMQLQRSVQM